MPAPSSEGAKLDLYRLAILRYAQNDMENVAWKNGTMQRLFPTLKMVLQTQGETAKNVLLLKMLYKICIFDYTYIIV